MSSEPLPKALPETKTVPAPQYDEHIAACPKCDNVNVRILDKGWKRFFRLIAGSTRYFCPVCRSTWRRHRPGHIRSITRKTRLLPMYQDDNWSVITLPTGQWHRSEKELLKTVDHLLRQGNKAIMLDMSRPQSFTSSSFGTILRVSRQCKATGAVMRICNAAPEIKEAFGMTSLDFLLAEEEEEKPSAGGQSSS